MNRRDFVTGLGASGLLSNVRAQATNRASEMRGLYVRESDDYVALGRFDEFGEGVYLFDYGRKRAGRLRSGATSLELLSTLDASGDPIARLEFANADLRINERNFHNQPIVRHEFRALTNGASIACEYAKRTDRSPVGIILMVYGSGPATKEALDLWSFHFLYRHWAVLTYDKRGCGESTGHWQGVSLEQLAADALVVLAEAKRHFPARLVGAWGISQGGWILPQLAARRAIDFMVMHAGAMTTPGQQILDQVAAELAAYGFDRAEMAKALKYYALDTEVSRGRKPWAEIERAYAEAQKSGAEWLLGPPEPASSPARDTIRVMADFDPIPFWRQSPIPTLAVFGSKDVIVPAEPNVPALHSLDPARTHIQTTVLRGANHIGMIADKGIRAEYARCTAMHQDYFTEIDHWLSHLVRTHSRREPD